MAAIKASILRNWAPWLCAGAAFGFIAFVVVGSAYAADKAVPTLGGDCCSDLEQRIAELEATTARKGNRKVTLTISGIVNESLMFWNNSDLLGGKADMRVGNNGVNTSRFNFSGEAHFSPSMKAGFVIEVAQQEWSFLTDVLHIGSSTELYARQANAWISGPMGKFTLGRAAQATRDLADNSVANLHDADKELSMQPFVGSGMTENLDLYDGQFLDVVRYDSPLMAGFVLSGSWGRDGTGGGTNVNDVWDAALRYAGSFQSVKINAGIGYRDGAVFPGLNPLLPFPVVAFDQKTWIVSGSAMHVPTGLFVDGAAGQAKINGLSPNELTVTTWEVRAGVEERWLPVGKTTVFALYETAKGDNIPGFNDNAVIYGAGVNQAIDGAATNLYFVTKEVQLNNGAPNAIVGEAGVAIHF